MTSATLSFRPDPGTLAALQTISKLTGVRDRSTMLRNAIRAYEHQLQVQRMADACAAHASDSEAMAEYFVEADNDVGT
mgnify:CR=1 FL=1